MENSIRTKNFEQLMVGSRPNDEPRQRPAGLTGNETNLMQALERDSQTDTKLSIQVIGRFTVLNSKNQQIRISSKRGQALLALLAVAPSGWRERRWLQYKLWSMRGEKEGSGSLRQTLSSIRKALGNDSDALLSDRTSIGLNLNRVAIDVHDLKDLLNKTPLLSQSDFLEGLDITDPEFENWLRDQRAFWGNRLSEVEVAPANQPIAKPNRAPAQLSASSTPVVAVMPFSRHLAMHQPQLSSHVMEGLFDDVIDQLAKIRWLSVISRSSVIAGANAGMVPSEFGSRFDANYVISLDLFSNGDASKLGVDLIRSQNMEMAWQKTFQLPESVAQADVRNIAIEIAGNVASQVSRVAQSCSQGRPSMNSSFSELLWRGKWHLHRLSKVDSQAAQQIFVDLIAQDPGNPEAHLHLAWTLMWEAWATRASEEKIRDISELGQKAIKLDNSDGRAFWIAGVMESWLRNFDLSNRFIDQAIELCPSLALAHMQRASNRIYEGHPAEALKSVETASRLSPMDTHRFFFLGEKAMAHFLLDDLDQALEASTQSLMLRRSYWYAHLIQTLSFARQGEQGKAAEAYRRLKWHTPDFQSEFISWLPFTDRVKNKEMIAELEGI